MDIDNRPFTRQSMERIYGHFKVKATLDDTGEGVALDFSASTDFEPIVHKVVRQITEKHKAEIVAILREIGWAKFDIRKAQRHLKEAKARIQIALRYGRLDREANMKVTQAFLDWLRVYHPAMHRLDLDAIRRASEMLAEKIKAISEGRARG